MMILLTEAEIMDWKKRLQVVAELKHPGDRRYNWTRLVTVKMKRNGYTVVMIFGSNSDELASGFTVQSEGKKKIKIIMSALGNW